MLAGETGSGVNNCGGTILGDSGNLSWPASNNCVFFEADPLLGVLQDNGGPPKTVLPAAGSPAIGAGVYFNGPTYHQRGVNRAIDAFCDSGAVEVMTAYNPRHQTGVVYAVVHPAQTISDNCP